MFGVGRDLGSFLCRALWKGISGLDAPRPAPPGMYNMDCLEGIGRIRCLRIRCLKHKITNTEQNCSEPFGGNRKRLKIFEKLQVQPLILVLFPSLFFGRKSFFALSSELKQEKAAERIEESNLAIAFETACGLFRPSFTRRLCAPSVLPFFWNLSIVTCSEYFQTLSQITVALSSSEAFSSRYSPTDLFVFLCFSILSPQTPNGSLTS